MHFNYLEENSLGGIFRLILNQPHELHKLANQINLSKHELASPLLRGKTSIQGNSKNYIFFDSRLALRESGLSNKRLRSWLHFARTIYS